MPGETKQLTRKKESKIGIKEEKIQNGQEMLDTYVIVSEISITGEMLKFQRKQDRGNKFLAAGDVKGALFMKLRRAGFNISAMR